MLLRRLAGVVTALLMLHLGLVAGDAACATHMVGAANASGAGTTQNVDMAAQMATHGRHEPCETPSRANCCQTLASCGPTFAVRTTRSSVPTLERAALPRSVIDIPLSALAGPDTPPPKA